MNISVSYISYELTHNDWSRGKESQGVKGARAQAEPRKVIEAVGLWSRYGVGTRSVQGITPSYAGYVMKFFWNNGLNV